MAITVNTNVFSLSAQRNVNRTQGSLQTAMQRLSSGLRINMAKDDAAGLAVAQRMEGQARGATVAQRNIADGISALGIADNGLRSMNDTIQRMRELKVQHSSGTYTSADKQLMSVEYTQLASELDDVLTRAKFNGLEVLNGDLSGVTMQVGANAGDTITLAVGTVSHGLTNISDALSTIDAALDTVNTSLADIGAYQSRLEKTMDTAMAIEEAQWAARGRIVDADFARETSRMTSAQIIQQAGVSALAQANQIPQLALGLLG